MDESSDLLYMLWTRIDPLGPGLHRPKLDGDVGWDLEAAERMVLHPGSQRDIPTNVRVQLPAGYWGEIRARSSIARMGLQVDAGVLDNGYTGPLFVLLRNMGVGRVEVPKGMRIAQLVLHRGAFHVLGKEVDELADDPRRGNAGFGSTGGLE